MVNVKIIKKNLFIVIIALLIVFAASTIIGIDKIENPSPNIKPKYDVVIYGGTSAGIIAACQIRKMGKTVLVIEPTNRIGGMTTNGLGLTDLIHPSTIGGLALQFYKDIGKEYGKKTPVWNFEPHIALNVFEAMIQKYSIPVVYNEKLKLKDGVVKSGRKIVSITMVSGKVYTAKEFMDATYEGDLMAEAGVSYTTGREPNSEYGETLNGVESAHALSHQFPKGVDPYIIKGDPKSGLLPGIQSTPIPKDGSGDNKIQSYCYRLCLTYNPQDRIAIQKPTDYNPLNYELLFRSIEKGQKLFGILSHLPNKKIDLNNCGAVSTDDIGANYNYINSDYATRAKILQKYKSYDQGLLWTLQNDPRVPKNIRDSFSVYGLPKDEFTDNDNWPEELYVREGRRMVSDFVMTQQYDESEKIVTDPIALGSYNMDSHNVQRYVSHGTVKNEGDLEIPIKKPYGISYSSIVPKTSECTNLLVPVCLSASHIAYGSIRMEANLMVIGQSAGTAAVYAIEDNVSVQNVNYKKLHDTLINDGQVLN
jgi:hypothetical protein